jgi:hypothetical protein
MDQPSLILLCMALLALLAAARGVKKRTPQHSDYSACPHCAEPIFFQAKVCKHCNRTVRRG